jgi:hypothetical protein
VDPDTNLDDDDQEIGHSIWRCIARIGTDQTTNTLFYEVFVVTNCIRRAEELTQIGVESLSPNTEEFIEIIAVNSNRISEGTLTQLVSDKKEAKGIQNKDLRVEQVLFAASLNRPSNG